MAYVSQEMKKELAPAIKEVCKKYGYKVSLSVNNHSTLVAKIKGAKKVLEDYVAKQQEPQNQLKRETYHMGPIDIDTVVEESAQWGHKVNEYWIEDNYVGDSVEFLKELVDAMKGPEYFCEDDAMTDYFYRSHYTDIEVYV